MATTGTWLVIAALVVLVGASAAANDATTVGVAVTTADGELARALAAGIGGRLDGSGVSVAEGCDDVTFCITVTAVAVRLGARRAGWAVASYVTRRLGRHPDWPWSPPTPTPLGGAAPPVIEDAYTAGGDTSCIDCERALEVLQREVAVARSLAAPAMVDEGDLQLQVGPATEGFVAEVTEAIVRGFVERHLRPYRVAGR